MDSGDVLTRAPNEAPIAVPDQRSRRKPAHRRPRQIQWPSVLCAVFIVLGSAVRLRQYFSRRSLWLDEASITDNLINRHMAGLLRPLAHHQGAPLGWLISEKIGIHLLGKNEYGLRLTSIVSGVLALFALWWLARRVLARWLVPLAVGAAAVSPQLIRYSSETKQYGSDALAVTFIVVLAVTITRLKPSALGWNSAATWAAGGSLVVMCSHPGIVATASCCLVLLARLWRSGHKAAFRRFVVACSVIAGALLAHYELVLKNLAADTALKNYWKSGNPPKPLAFGSFIRWLGRVVVDYVHDPLQLGPALLIGALFAAGTVTLARRDRAACALVIGPLLVQLAVSAAGIFPLSGRLVLGYVPLILVVLASAPGVMAGRRWISAALSAAVIAPLVPNVANAAKLTVHPLRFEEIRPVLQAVQRDYRPGQLIYVHYPAIAAFDVYREMGIHLPVNGKMFIAHAPTCADNQLLRRMGAVGKQVWFISSHQLSSAPHEAAEVRARLRAQGTVLREITAPGAQALLIQIRSSYSSLTPGAPGDCLQTVRAY